MAQFYRLPHLTALRGTSESAFQFTFPNPTDINFTVLATTDVASPTPMWEVLGSPVPMGGGLYQFTDPAATNGLQRFYQLRTL